MPSRGGVQHSPDLTARLTPREVLPAGPSLPRTPSRFGKMQGTKRASTELAYLAMMRTASHGDDHSFADLIARLNSAGELPAEPSRVAATPSTPNTPSRSVQSPRSTYPSTTPSTPHTCSSSEAGSHARQTPSLSERVIHHISRGSSAEFSAASTTPSPPRTPSQVERHNSCRSTASRSSLRLSGATDKPRQTVSWATHVECWRLPSQCVTWSTHIQVLVIPSRERAADDW